MSAYYNEIEPYAAQWLRNLISANLIAPGEVDERSIEDVKPAELAGFTQCHFFAGTGAWSYALRLAGWPDDRPVWTGSCPCQPFSAAGKGKGFDDERHLWPHWHWLITQLRPECVFGEQVGGGGSSAWIDLVHADLEAVDYAFGCVPFPAASTGSPHVRDRIYWLAHAAGVGRKQEHSDACGDAPRVFAEGLGARLGPGGTTFLPRGIDGRRRPIESGTEPLAHGAPARMGRLRAYGNGIVATQAAEFIRAAIGL